MMRRSKQAKGPSSIVQPPSHSLNAGCSFTLPPRLLWYSLLLNSLNNIQSALFNVSIGSLHLPMGRHGKVFPITLVNVWRPLIHHHNTTTHSPATSTSWWASRFQSLASVILQRLVLTYSQAHDHDSLPERCWLRVRRKYEAFPDEQYVQMEHFWRLSWWGAQAVYAWVLRLIASHGTGTNIKIHTLQPQFLRFHLKKPHYDPAFV